MIKVFNDTDKLYKSNGDAVIAATKARVKNADNGDYTLELTCSSDYSDVLQANKIIVAPTPQGEQAFRVRSIEKRSNRLDAKAYHVFYDADNLIIADSYAVNKTAKQALKYFNNATDIASPFTMDSDILSMHNLRIVRKSLAEAIVEVIERWGGHLVRDNYNIAVKGSIGKDYGVTIQYKKNLKELTASYDWSSVVTKLLPVGKDGVLLQDLYVYSETQYNIPFTKTVTFEQDIEREDYPSDAAYIAALRADLKKQAKNYLAIACVPTINYTLRGNPEKATDIGDIIEVKDARIGVDVLTKVISYEYDAITNKYVTLEFGNFTPKLSSLMSDIKAETSIQIANATSNINVEVNGIVDAITALNSLVTELEEDKQDLLGEGRYIDITDNIVNCDLTAGDGIDIDADNAIKLAPLSMIEIKDNIIATVDTNVITLFINLPRPIDTYNIESYSLKIYTTQGAGTTIDIDNTIADITLASEIVNDYTLEITLTDAGQTLTGLAGAYNAYAELIITN